MPTRRALRGLILTFVCLVAILPGQAVTAAPNRVTVASVTLSPSSGLAGTATSLLGIGFPARMRGVLTVGSASSTVRTDGKGVVLQSVVISPAAQVGDVRVRLQVGSVTSHAIFVVLAPPAPRPVRSTQLEFGIALPSGFYGRSELDSLAAALGESPSIVHGFSDFTREPDLVGLKQADARGAVPMLTLEPWSAGGGPEQATYSLDRVAGGAFDGYLLRWAAALRSYGKPVLLRFGHEMNGDWYPWSERVNGNEPHEFIAAWRHVHGLFRTTGADNVSWVWSPNVPYPGSLPLDGLYPGDAYVDVVALDAYNFGTSADWSTWLQPEQLYAQGLTELRRLAPIKPIMIAETASSELGGDKAAWVRDAVAFLAQQTDVVAFVWFHFDKETDWRIDSSERAVQAFAQALALRKP